MENSKRLLLPALIALLIHGLLIGLHFPAHQPLSRSRQADSIRIEIKNVLPGGVEPRKQGDPAQKVAAARVLSQKVEHKENTIENTLENTIAPVPTIAPRAWKKVTPKVARRKPETIRNKPDTTAGRQKSQVESEPHQNAEVPAAAKGASSGADTARTRLVQGKASSVTDQTQAQPIYLRNSRPGYPEIARRRGYTGEVLLSVLVNAGGGVADIKVKHSSGHAILDKAALQAVRNWLFIPATQYGRPVAMRVDVPIRFQLKK